MSENKPKNNKKSLIVIAAIAAIGILSLSAFKNKSDAPKNDDTKQKPPTPNDTTVKYPVAKVGITKTNTIAIDNSGSESNVPEKTTLYIVGIKPVSKTYDTDKGFIPMKDVTITGSDFNNNTNQN